MLNDPESVAEALAPTLLGGRRVVELPGFEPAQRIFAVPCGHEEIVDAWSAARDAIAPTGRSPVVVASWGTSGPEWLDEAVRELERRRAIDAHFGHHPGFQREAAREVNPRTLPHPVEVLADIKRMLNFRSPADHELADTARSFGAAPEDEDVLAVFGVGDPPRYDLDRWLFEWERARFGSVPDLYTGYLDGFGPPGLPAVVLLPTPRGADTLFFVPFFQNGCAETPERLVAVVRSWEERFGADLWANWGTMLEFVVARPPATVEDAYELALEQALIAPDTIMLPGVRLRRHAQALVGRQTWFLHYRP